MFWRFVLVWALVATSACTTSTPADVVVRVLLAEDWAGTAPVVAAVRAFEELHPDVRVQVEGVAFEFMAEAIEAGVDAGDPADLAQFHAFAMGSLGLAERVDELWAKHGLEESEFFPGAVRDVRWGDALYGLPLDGNAMVMLYNARRFQRTGTSPPRAGYGFDDLRAMAEAVSTEHAKALSFSSSTWRAFGWLRANGGDLVEVARNGSVTFTFDTERNAAVLDMLAGLVRDGLAFPPVGSLGDREDAFELFRSETTWMLPTGSWDLATLLRQDPWPVGVAPMPRGEGPDAGGSVLGGSSLLVPRGAVHGDLGFEFALALIDDDIALRLATEEGRLPVRVRLYDDEALASPQLQVFFEQMRNAEPFLLEAFPAEHTVFRDALIAILRGDRDATSALRAAQGRVDALRD